MTEDDLTRLHVLRGRYIDKAIEIESLIDVLIGQFFQVNSRYLLQEFQWWVLNEMTLNSKIRAVRSIADELATDVDTAHLSTALETMVGRRNDFAHRRIGSMVVVDEDGRHDGGLIKRPRRPRRREDQFETVDLAELDRYLADLDELLNPLAQLIGAAHRQWPYTSETGGVVTHHPGTLSEADE